jgi:cytidylate kinase
MEKKRQITIGGVPGAGKTTTAKKIAALLDFNFYSVGDFRREIAQIKFDTDINTLNSLEEAKFLLVDVDVNDYTDMELLSKVEHLDLQEKDIPKLRKIMNLDTDVEADNMQKELGMKGNEFIIEGRLAWKFCPKAFSIFFDCDPEVAAERILKDNRESEKNFYSIEEAKEANLRRMESDTKRYEQKYGHGYDCYNPKNFNFVINTTNLTPEAVVEKVLQVFDEYYGGMEELENEEI